MSMHCPLTAQIASAMYMQRAVSEHPENKDV